MDGFVDLQDAIDAESKYRLQRIERLAGFCAFVMLGAALWLAWPALSAAIEGDSMTSDLKYALVVIAWGVFIQDVGYSDKKSRSRIGTISSIAWLPILIVGIGQLEGDISQLVGMLLLVVTSYALFRTSRAILDGDVSVTKFRSLMGFLGIVLSISLLTTSSLDTTTAFVQLGILCVGILFVIIDWFSNDENRALRKDFDKRLNGLENRILLLKSEGAAVDQAASLIMTAREEGHREPDWGMRLLDEAEEDIERSLSLADDVEDIKNDSLKAVEKAESIAPIAKRPRKAWDMGLREVELGSLREGEALFRQAKKRASEIIEWWQKAEEAIRKASALLAKAEHKQDSLVDLLADSKQKLSTEKPKKAYEFAMVIPNQLAASDDALKIAEESVKEAARQLKSADGINKSRLESRLDSAETELESGNHSQAKGLADGVIREINAEREAMDDVRRALRQKVRWSNREDSSDWDSRLTQIEKAVDELEWTHAAALLERLTKDLDAENKASDEVVELLEYVMEEWNILRNQCDASSIKVDDEDRRSTEEAIALAKDSHKAGKINEALESLGLADSFMEKLRRRV